MLNTKQFNYIEVPDSFGGLATNGLVLGLGKSLKESGYAMRTDITQEEDVEKMLKRGARLGGTEPSSGHGNYLTGIVVRFDMSVTNKVWVEAERYHFLQLVTSQSTMHRITKMNLDDACISYTNRAIIKLLQERIDQYNDITRVLDTQELSDEDRAYKASVKKKLYLEILYSTPSGLRLTSGINTNYMQLKTMVMQRYNHRLPEWREFCAWVMNLPYFEELTGLSKKKYVIAYED